MCRRIWDIAYEPNMGDYSASAIGGNNKTTIVHISKSGKTVTDAVPQRFAIRAVQAGDCARIGHAGIRIYLPFSLKNENNAEKKPKKNFHSDDKHHYFV